MIYPTANRRIVIGVTGGIAAYKALDLVSILKKHSAVVKVVMTENATEFVCPLSFEALSGNPVYTGMFTKSVQWEIDHISLARWAELIVVVPATANVLGKVSHGIADDLLTTMIMASEAPVLFAPAMNAKMYSNSIVQENLSVLINHGYQIIPPESGRLACGESGEGKLADVIDIFKTIENVFTKEKDLTGYRVLVTAGPTREYFDPTRFISNPSTGKMGFALAHAAIERGAVVSLVSGPTKLVPPRNASFYAVESADEMYRIVMKLFPENDIVIKAAAVSDYKPLYRTNQKTKKSQNNVIIELISNPDILFELGKLKTKQIIVGFAAETSDIEENAKRKLLEKNLDIIVANDVSGKQSGFASDSNQGILYTRDGGSINIPLVDKKEFAHKILNQVVKKINLEKNDAD